MWQKKSKEEMSKFDENESKLLSDHLIGKVHRKENL